MTSDLFFFFFFLLVIISGLCITETYSSWLWYWCQCVCCVTRSRGEVLYHVGQPLQSRPGASHYRWESCFLIAGHRRRLPDSGVMGARVIIIKYTGPTWWKVLRSSNSCFLPPKNHIPRPSPIHGPPFPTVLIPVSWGALYFYLKPEVNVLQM